MKLTSLLFLHLVESVRATTIDTPNIYKNNCTNPIVFNDLVIPTIIEFVKEGFGKGFDWQERIIIKGKVFETPDQFEINLAEDGAMYQTADIQLHFNPRFQSKQVVRNTWIKNIGWGREDISGGFPFKAGEPFILEFVAMPRDFIYISVNNKFFAYFRSYTLSQISQIYIAGVNTVRINSLTLCPNALKVRELPSTEAPTTPYPRCLKTIDLQNVVRGFFIDKILN